MFDKKDNMFFDILIVIGTTALFSPIFYFYGTYLYVKVKEAELDAEDNKERSAFLKRRGELEEKIQQQAEESRINRGGTRRIKKNKKKYSHKNK
jgi:hypothetical protein